MPSSSKDQHEGIDITAQEIMDFLDKWYPQDLSSPSGKNCSASRLACTTGAVNQYILNVVFAAPGVNGLDEYREKMRQALSGDSGPIISIPWPFDPHQTEEVKDILHALAAR